MVAVHTIKMSKVENPDPAQMVVTGKLAPILYGDGDNTYVCCACDAVLLYNMRVDQLRGLSFKCPTCGDYSAMPETHAGRPARSAVRALRPGLPVVRRLARTTSR